MGSGFDCDDCGRLIAGADRGAVLAAKWRHENDEGHTMSEVEDPD